MYLLSIHSLFDSSSTHRDSSLKVRLTHPTFLNVTAISSTVDGDVLSHIDDIFAFFHYTMLFFRNFYCEMWQFNNFALFWPFAKGRVRCDCVQNVSISHSTCSLTGLKGRDNTVNYREDDFLFMTCQWLLNRAVKWRIRLFILHDRSSFSLLFFFWHPDTCQLVATE